MVSALQRKDDHLDRYFPRVIAKRRQSPQFSGRIAESPFTERRSNAMRLEKVLDLFGRLGECVNGNLTVRIP